MRGAAVCGLLVIGVLAAGCGSSRKAFVCPVSGGHAIDSPLEGQLVVLGGPPVEVRIDNRGDLRHGVVVLGTSDYAGWFALKSHFVTPPSYQGGFTVRVRPLRGKGGVGLGGQPPGHSFTAAAGPAPNQAGGWRDFPGGWTWTRRPGCLDWDITAAGLHESIVVRTRRG